jgi:hypothetical protein
MDRRPWSRSGMGRNRWPRLSGRRLRADSAIATMRRSLADDAATRLTSVTVWKSGRDRCYLAIEVLVSESWGNEPWPAALDEVVAELENEESDTQAPRRMRIFLAPSH